MTDRKNCDVCEGDGDVKCIECDGTGELEDENGPYECDCCNGEGVVECGDCDGEGTVED